MQGLLVGTVSLILLEQDQANSFCCLVHEIIVFNSVVETGRFGHKLSK